MLALSTTALPSPSSVIVTDTNGEFRSHIGFLPLLEADQAKKDLAAEGKAYTEHPGMSVVRQLCEIGRVGGRLGRARVVALATNAGPSPLAGAQCKPNVFSMAWQNDGAAEARYADDGSGTWAMTGAAPGGPVRWFGVDGVEHTGPADIDADGLVFTKLADLAKAHQATLPELFS